MFEPTADNHPFLGPSYRITPTIPTRAQPSGRPQIATTHVTRRNDNVGPVSKFNEPATPQPREASKKPKPVKGVEGQVGINS